MRERSMILVPARLSSEFFSLCRAQTAAAAAPATHVSDPIIGAAACGARKEREATARAEGGRAQKMDKNSCTRRWAGGCECVSAVAMDGGSSSGGTGCSVRGGSGSGFKTAERTSSSSGQQRSTSATSLESVRLESEHHHGAAAAQARQCRRRCACSGAGEQQRGSSSKAQAQEDQMDGSGDAEGAAVPSRVYE